MDVYTFAHTLQRVKPGRWIIISREIMRQLRWNSMLYEHPAEHVMEHISGSAYEWSFEEDTMTGDVIFKRRDEPLRDGLRTYVSPDRRHLFLKRQDGLWENRKMPETDAERALRHSRRRVMGFPS